MVRPRQAILSRQLIGAKAIELVESGRELQVQPLANLLGVSVSSLYHHVDGRVGIIRAMREALIEQHHLEPGGGGHWIAVVRRGASIMRDLYGSHPRTMLLLLTVEISEPPVLGFYEEMVGALDSAGVPENLQLSVVEAIDAFAMGVAIDSLSPDDIFEPHDDTTALLQDRLAMHLTGARRNERVFDVGLDLIIQGIKTTLSEASPGS